MADRTQSVEVFAPASVSNVGCGFDVLGFALEGAGDVVTARRSDVPGVEISSIRGDEGKLPIEAERNTAGRAAIEVLSRLGTREGVVLEVEKQMPLSSGLGSSAASAVAAAVATSLLFEPGLEEIDLLECALAGESLASGAIHADNVAPSLLGGFVLVRSLHPSPDIVSLPVPEGLSCALARPHLEIDTAPARRALAKDVPLRHAVVQWGNVGALVASLYRGDLELLGRSLCDVIAEPVRARWVPGFDLARRAALQAGALGCSLSGSGPTLFALCHDQAEADRVSRAMADQLEGEGGADCDAWTSRVGAAGARRRTLTPSV